MRKYSTRMSLAIGILLILLGTISSCRIIPYSVEPGYEEQELLQEGYYQIDSITILDALADGKMDVFESLSEPPASHPILPAKPVEWSQSNYLQIAVAFFEYLQEPVSDGWNLNMMLFKMSCDKSIFGPQHAFLEYFKISYEQGGKTRYLQRITIKPLENLIIWSKLKYSPVINDWHLIDATKLNVSANDAFQIAEENGGSEIRLNAGNECTVYITLSPDGLYKGWRVAYTSGDPNSLLDVYVDEFTGNFSLEYSRNE